MTQSHPGQDPPTPEEDRPLDPEATVPRVKGIRLLCESGETFERMVSFYGALLGRKPDQAFGERTDVQQAASWRMVQGFELILAREPEPTPEAYVDPSNGWLCLLVGDVDATHGELLRREIELWNDPIDTTFGTRAFFTNDPAGNTLYLGEDWRKA